MKRIFLILFLLASVISAQVSYPPLWYPKTSTNLVTLGNYNVGINSLYNYMIGDTAIFRLRNGQVQFLSAGVWTAIPDTSISAGGWSDNGSNLTPTTITDTVKMKYATMISGGNWGSPTFTAPSATGIFTSDMGFSPKNLSAIPTGITTDYSRFTTVDDGATVKPYLVSDDNATETNQLILTDKQWSGFPSAYQMDNVDDKFVVPDNDNLDFGTGDFFIEWYGKPSLFVNVGSSWNTLVSKGSAFSSAGWGFVYGAGNALTFAVNNVTSCYTSVSHITDQRFIHVVGTRTGTTINLYVNGRLVNTVTSASVGNTVSNSDVFQINGDQDDVARSTKQIVSRTKVGNRILTQAEITAHYNNAVIDLYKSDYSDRGASNTKVATYDSSAVNDSTITLTWNKKYRWTKGNADSLKIGATAYTDTVEFTWTTGSVYAYGDLTGSNLIPIGCVAEYLPQNAGRLGWIESSGNQLSGATSGSPICLNAEERPPTYRDVKSLIVANTNTTLTNIIPRGYKIVDIEATGSDSLTAVKIGSSSGGEEIVASTTTVSTNSKLLALASTANDGYSSTADRTLYARHGTSATGKTMKLIFYLTKIGN